MYKLFITILDYFENFMYFVFVMCILRYMLSSSKCCKISESSANEPPESENLFVADPPNLEASSPPLNTICQPPDDPLHNIPADPRDYLPPVYSERIV